MKESMIRLQHEKEGKGLKCNDRSSSSICQSHRRGRTKRLIFVRLLHTTVCCLMISLIIPLGEAFKLNDNDVDVVGEDLTSMTNNSQIVTISQSYSSTNFKKAGPHHRGNFSSHNKNNAVRRRRISLSTLHANKNDADGGVVPHGSIKVEELNLKLEQPTGGVISRPIISSSSTSVISSSSSSSKKRSNKNQRQRQRHGTTVYSSSASSSPSLNLINSTRKVGGGQAINVQPTMHPLRVLQTQISLLNKTQQQQFRSKHSKAKVTIINSTTSDNTEFKNNNWYNHRFPKNISTPYSITSPSTIQPIYNSSKDKNNHVSINLKDGHIKVESNSHLSPPPPVLERHPLLGRQEEDSLIDIDQLTTTTEDFSGVNDDDENNYSKVEGRSAVKKMNHIDESIQLPSIYHHDQLDDNIAEEDHNQEVTELVNHYPDPPPPKHRLPPLPHMQMYSHSHQKQSLESQFHPHHNYHSFEGSLNNFRPDKTHQRPKLNSYYDSNYYTTATGDGDQQQQQQQQPTNHDIQYEFKHHQPMNKNEYNYYSNGDHHPNNYNSNGNKEPPEHHQHQLAYLHQQPQHQQIQYHQPPTHHPHHPPYKGGDQDLMSSDTIMDRFEVFYKEYKLLTWASFFVLASLALLCVLVYLYINNPPTEVVTMRSKLTEYLQDPGLIKFLTSLVDIEPSRKGSTRRRRKKNLTNSHSPKGTEL